MEHPAMTKPDTRPDTDIPAALAHLAAVGVTEQVLTSDGVDVTDPVALLDQVVELIDATVTKQIFTSATHLAHLSAAFKALSAEPELADRLAATLDSFVSVIYAPPGSTAQPSARFGSACLGG
jgi:hypothetical protein